MKANEQTLATLYAANQHGISLRQTIVLLHLQSRGDGTSTTGALAELVGTSRAALTGMMDAMATKSLVTRTHGISDRRNILIHLTDKGDSIASKVASANQNTPPPYPAEIEQMP